MLRWATVDQLWVLLQRGSVTSCSERRRPLDSEPTSRWRTCCTRPSRPTSRRRTSCNDIAVHDPARGPFGSLYLAHARRPLGRRRRPAVVVRRHVEVAQDRAGVEDDRGRARGRGRTRPPRHRLRRHRHRRVPGHDHLQRRHDPRGRPGPDSTTASPTSPCRTSRSSRSGPIRLLRAATQARGVWELDLAGPVTDRTYVRVHQYDTRRTLADVRSSRRSSRRSPTPPTPRARSTPPTAGTPARTCASTRSSGAMAGAGVAARGRGPTRPAPAPRTGSASWRLWRFQTALRHDDPRSRADRRLGRHVRRRPASQRRADAGRRADHHEGRTGRARSRAPTSTGCRGTRRGRPRPTWSSTSPPR